MPSICITSRIRNSDTKNLCVIRQELLGLLAILMLITSHAAFTTATAQDDSTHSDSPYVDNEQRDFSRNLDTARVNTETGSAMKTPSAAVTWQEPVPLMAYYYIWFEKQSWERAKSDYPLLGRYSSDDRTVMEQHVRLAKAAGIRGFIVSWKSTSKLDPRLEQLMDVAAQEDFYLWIIYQGLDFNRDPQPISTIDHDLEYFITNYADHPAFAMYDKPVIIWSGTWAYSPQDVYAVTSSYSDNLYILASERNLAGYQRLAGIVDGNAYYWSSVNPETFPGYEEKLVTMGQAVHDNGGLWVAPAAPGFDARLIGGKNVVERSDGATLLRELNSAQLSSPDVIGLISWNEFSENTHLEPSGRYGKQALDVLTRRQLTHSPTIKDFDSSAPGTTNHQSYYGLYILGGLSLFVGGSVALLFYRLRHQPPQSPRLSQLTTQGDVHAKH
jgi:Glycosyl hydrolase family 99